MSGYANAVCAGYLYVYIREIGNPHLQNINNWEAVRRNSGQDVVYPRRLILQSLTSRMFATVKVRGYVVGFHHEIGPEGKPARHENPNFNNPSKIRCYSRSRIHAMR